MGGLLQQVVAQRASPTESLLQPHPPNHRQASGLHPRRICIAESTDSNGVEQSNKAAPSPDHQVLPPQSNALKHISTLPRTSTETPSGRAVCGAVANRARESAARPQQHRASHPGSSLDAQGSVSPLFTHGFVARRSGEECMPRGAQTVDRAKISYA